MLRRIWILFVARNKEFYRDRSAFGWNLLFPFFIIIGFSLLFNEEGQTQLKVGVLNAGAPAAAYAEQYRKFRKTRFLEFVELDSAGAALPKLLHHRIDLLIDPAGGLYWVSSSSPKGYIAERLLQSCEGEGRSAFARQSVRGREIPYVEWLFPGILGMNIMFSSLFGVGYVVVRYRKNGALKRLSVTPVRPHEFLAAQVLSREFLIVVTTAIVYFGCALLYGFQCKGSYFTLFLAFALGGLSMVSLGLLVASRSSSEEFAGGVLNIVTWPMMFLSEVWFSMEGARPWLQKAAKFLPLSPMIEAARKIMNDGAGLFEVRYQMLAMALMAAVFLTAGSLLFRWHRS